MKIYNDSEYIENPTVGDLKLEVNSMWNFKSRDVCFKNIQKSFGGGAMLISYDLNICVDVVDGIIIGGTKKVKNTKWKQAEITPEIIKQLEEKGYSVSKTYKKLPAEEIPQMKGTLEALDKLIPTP